MAVSLIAGAFEVVSADTPLVGPGNNPVIAVVNTNDNNSLTDPEDCKIMAVGDDDAVMNHSGVITVTAVQSPTNETSRQYCNEDYTGPAFLSPGGGQMNLSIGGDGTLQSIINLFFGSSSTPSSTLAVGGANGNGAPVVLNAAELNDLFGGFRGEGFLCEEGGPGLQMTLDNGVTLLFKLRGFPNSSNPTHMCVPQVPLEAGIDDFEMDDICFPVDSNGNLSLFVQGSDTPFLTAPLSGLPSCTLGRRAAPTASEMGLILLALALLGGGTWLLSRRERFAASLPRL
jgi:hypothetical protein